MVKLCGVVSNKPPYGIQKLSVPMEEFGKAVRPQFTVFEYSLQCRHLSKLRHKIASLR